MDMNSPPHCPNTVTVRRNPHRKARATPATAPTKYSTYPDLPEISVFPLEEILSAGPENPPLEPSSKAIGESKNTKVFLRIRPLFSSKGFGKVSSIASSRAKTAWPQNPAKKSTVAGEKSAKKKSSRVCVIVNDSQTVTLSPPIDLQDSKRIKSETYGGFSHVFSTDSSQVEVYERMVKPIVEDFINGTSGMLAALGPSGSGKTHTVFGCPREPGMVPLALRQILKGNQSSRSFYISIFEISSERGKVEKLFDLLPDGAQLSMQQSNVKGLQEILISDAGHAESLIAQAMVKRATAMTNTNSQSSRSQCIINIRAVPKKCEGVSAQSNCAVLTIIDLAGAEREKKTRNQGTRLLESNFINNTLMVFGLCLRSLLEHQKNPKKPLQKHFQNSMLTRYLRDYLEGKQRMTLILTAKSGEEDYLDTSHLLRQASPYMKIKYNEVEPSNMVPNKRQYQSSSTMEHVKPSSTLKHAKRIRLVCCEDSNEEKGAEERHISEEEASRVKESDANNCIPLKSECRSWAQSERNRLIMQNFAKAMWSVLKQYNAKLKVAEVEIQSLRESIGYEKQKHLELQKDLNEFKACCTCCKRGKVDTYFQSQLGLDGLISSNVDEVNDRAVGPDPNKVNCVDNELKSELMEAFDAPASPEKYISVSQCCSILDQLDKEPRLGTSPESSDREVSASSSKPEDLNALEVKIESHKLTELLVSSPFPKDEALGPSLPKDASPPKERDLVDEPKRDHTRATTSCNAERPKRRLMPSSSILLRDLSTLDLADETEKSKGSRGTRKLAAEDLNRTNGSITLLRLLKSNLHL